MTTPVIEPQLGVTLRPFTPDDYEAAVAVSNAVFPEYPETADQWRWRDKTRDPKCKSGRVVALQGEQMVGVADYSQSSGMYHPRKFHVGINVLTSYRGSGVGGALYAALRDTLTPFDPIALQAEVRADHEDGLRFAQAHGFVEVMREQESELDLSTFDPAAYLGEIEKVEAQGIVLQTAGELFATDQNAHRKMYELGWQISQDIPHPDEQTRPDYDVWIKRFENPDFLPEGNIYAVETATGEYVGASMLWGSGKNDPSLHTGLTGILRSHRKRGIATALKLRALTYAKQGGWKSVRTWNEVNNNGMLGINFRLGFERRPPWLQMNCTLKEEES